MFAAASVLLAPSRGVAQDESLDDLEIVVPQRPDGEVVFRPVMELDQEGSDYNARLRGGQVGRPTDWPASLFLEYADAQGRPHPCTSVLIGPEVLLTAAHCVPASGRISVQRRDAPTLGGVCASHPRYPETSGGAGDLSADFALCRLSQPYVLAQGGRYETVSRRPMSSAVGTENNFILLTGFGCTSDVIAEAGRGDRLYRIGYAAVDETSASTTRLRVRGELYADVQNFNLFTVNDPAFANLCPGDSGGPAFNLINRDITSREIIAVNSRVLQSRTRFRGSLLSSTGHDDFRRWALAWLGPTLTACGLRNGRLACR